MKKLRVKAVVSGAIVALASYVALAQTDPVKDQLSANRQRIDAIDRQIVELINQRTRVVDKIGEIKSAAGLPVSAPQRE